MKADYELDEIDSEIYKFLDLKEPQSFLLFAGAGSGKTKTLVNVFSNKKFYLQAYSRKAFLTR